MMMMMATVVMVVVIVALMLAKCAGSDTVDAAEAMIVVCMVHSVLQR